MVSHPHDQLIHLVGAFALSCCFAACDRLPACSVHRRFAVSLRLDFERLERLLAVHIMFYLLQRIQERSNVRMVHLKREG
jgi:hypothetical protein